MPPTSRAQALALALRNSEALTLRFASGFDDTTRTTQAPTLPNHFAWSLGHMALTMWRASEKIDGRMGLPQSDFVEGGSPQGGGDARRFAVESVAFASRPQDAPEEYPCHARCTEIFHAAIEQCAGAVESVEDAVLDESVIWGAASMAIPRHALASRMVFHNGMHAGQLADLRRALGMKSVFS